MSFLFKLILVGCIIVSIFSCTTKKPVAEKERKAYSLTIQLPFESGNYESDTNFILKDISGKICSPGLDTVTKGGGTITYDSLTGGIYTYSVKTIFDETYSSTINLQKDSTISLSPGEIYGLKDAITLDSLTMADSIKIILYDTALYSEVIIRKTKNKYMISFQGPGKKDKLKQVIKDSTTTIKALIELQVSMLGLEAIGMHDPSAYYFYQPETSFYMKTRNEYINCDNILQEYFNKVHRQFLKAILQ